MPDPRRQPRRQPRGRARAVPVVCLVAALLALAAAGCASIPSSGPVRAGAAVETDSDPGYRVEPLGPQPGASPQEVVRGFYLAGVGVDDDFAAARRFLAPARRSSWRPGDRTVVHALGALSVSAPVPEGAATGSTATGSTATGSTATAVTVTVTTTVTGQVDSHGQYTAAGPGASLSLPLHLVRARGQWRITDAPDLLLLDDPDFERVFVAAPVYFPDRSGQVMVPDERWVLDRSSIATTLVAALLTGPSAVLAPAVTSGASSGSELGQGSVVVDDGLATVDLPRHFGDEPAASLRLLQQQLVATLQALPDVSQVRVSVDGGALPATAAPRLAGTGSTGGSAVDAGQLPLHDDTADVPLVLASGHLARLVGSSLSPVSGLPDLSGVAASAPASLSGQYAALGDGGSQLLRLGTRASPVLTGTALTAPSFDEAGWLWSTSAACTGTVSAVSRTGRVVAVEAPWLAGRTLTSLRVAPDGARVLVASTGAGGDVRVDVAALRRADDGTPQRLYAGAGSTTSWLAGVRAAAWIGDTDVAVLGTAAAGSPQAQTTTSSSGSSAPSQPSVWVISAGRPRSLGAPAGASADPVRLAAGSDQRSLVVGTADGRLWQLAGIDWVPSAASGTDPAYPG